MDSQEIFTDLLRRTGVTVSRNLEESFAEAGETYPHFEDLDTPVENQRNKKTKTKRGRAFTDEEDNLITESPVNDKTKGNGKKNIASSSSSEALSLRDDSAPTPIFYGQTERPGGRKAAKESVAKQRNDEHQQAKLQTTLARMDENALKMHIEKMELLKEAMAAERERDDHAILTMDMSNLDTPTKTYYKIKKVEILKRAGVLE